MGQFGIIFRINRNLILTLIKKNKFKLDINLEESWHANRERRLAKAQ